MGYQGTWPSVEKVLKQLEQLANSSEDQIVFEHRSPNTLKYALHQGFFAAKELKIQKYQGLGDVWKIRIKGVKVICERREQENFSTSAAEEITRKIYSVSKFNEVLGALIAEGNRFNEQHFPGFILTSTEESTLTGICLSRDKKWSYHEDPQFGLTIESNGNV